MKHCERCGGRLFPDSEGDLSCIACGHIRYASDPLPLIPHSHGSKYDHGSGNQPEIRHGRIGIQSSGVESRYRSEFRKAGAA